MLGALGSATHRGCPNDQFGLEQNVLRSLCQEQIHSCGADQSAGLVDARKGNNSGGRERDVVIADQGNVFRDTDVTEQRERLQHANGKQVVDAEHGVRTICPKTGSDIATDFASCQNGQLSRSNLLEARSRHLSDGLARSKETIRHLTDRFGSAYDCDASMAQSQEVLDCEPAARDVVDRHR